MSADAQKSRFSSHDGEGCRKSPHEGEITEGQMKGGMERVLREAPFAEGDAMRDKLWEVFDRAMASSEADEEVADAPAQAPVADAHAPEATPERLDEVGQGKVRKLFESPKAGYEGYALKVLRDGGIDPDALPEDSAPLWESPEAALTELLSHLTPAHLEVIQSDYSEPAIVVEPIRVSDLLFVKDESVPDYDRRVVGETPFFGSAWLSRYLSKVDQRDGVGSMDSDRIVGWNIGIVDKAQRTKVLATDGDVNTKKVEDRARDFYAEGGYGSKGFTSATDHPRLYGMIMNASRSGDSPQPIDDVEGSGGVWTMGTRLYGPNAEVYDADKHDFPRVAGGHWLRNGARAYLHGYDADFPRDNARVRLAVMFKKESLTLNFDFL